MMDRGTERARGNGYGRLALCAAAAGLCNGLLGTGGGMILVFGLTAGKRYGGKEAFILSALGVLVFSAVSALFYAAGGRFETEALARFLPGAVVGGLLGAVLVRHIDTAWLRLLFGALLLFGGARILGVI